MECTVPRIDFPFYDIGLANLRAAVGLPGSEKLRVAPMLEKLDEWAERIRSSIDRNWHRFIHNPEEFEHCEGYFLMLVTSTVLRKELGFRYVPKLTESAAAFRRLKRDDGRNARLGDTQLAEQDGYEDARNLFIHGLLTVHGGTCTSMPVLLLAIGQRLDFPLHMACCPQHSFVRWDDGRYRFNIEATAPGLSTPTDTHVAGDPSLIRDLTDREVWAHFLFTRGHCLLNHHRDVEALAHFEAACTHAPDDIGMKTDRDCVRLWEWRRLNGFDMEVHGISASKATYTCSIPAPRLHLDSYHP